MSGNAHRWTFVLAFAAACNVLCYGVFFARPFDLLLLYSRPLINLYRLSQENPGARGWLIAGYLALAALYWVGWQAARRAQGRMAWAAVLSGALLSGVVLLRVMPLGAADIFDNIMHGRIVAVYGANPFVDVVRQYRGDPFYGYTAWRDVPSAYGPAWELLAAWTTRLAGVALLVWNPVILVQTLGEGHNDIAMAAMVLVGAWLLVERRRTAAILALVAAALLKFIPVLLLPAAGVIALRDQPSTRARVRFLAITGALAIALVALTYAPFWHGEETLGIWRRQGLFTTSLPAVSYSLVGPVLGQARAARIISLTAAALTGAFALYQAARTARDRSWLAFPRAAFNILMFYLLVTCLWFQDWYTIWPLALAALFPPGRETGLAVLFAYAGLAKPLVFGPQWLWRDPLPPPGWREIRLGPAVLAAPWLYALHAWWSTRRPLNHAPEKPARSKPWSLRRDPRATRSCWSIQADDCEG